MYCITSAMEKYLFLIVLVIGPAQSFRVEKPSNQDSLFFDPSFQSRQSSYQYKLNQFPRYEHHEFGNHKSNYSPWYDRRHYDQTYTQNFGSRRNIGNSVLFWPFPTQTFLRPRQEPTPQPESSFSPPVSSSSESFLECTRKCPVTSEYNPVCGTDNVTYTNPGKLYCAQFCGVDVKIKRTMPCAQRMVATTVSTPTSRPTRPSQLPLPEDPSEMYDYFDIDARFNTE